MTTSFYWREECTYIAEQAEPFVRGYGPSEFQDVEHFIRYCVMQRDKAEREKIFDAAQYIQHILDDLADPQIGDA